MGAGVRALRAAEGDRSSRHDTKRGGRQSSGGGSCADAGLRTRPPPWRARAVRRKVSFVRCSRRLSRSDEPEGKIVLVTYSQIRLGRRTPVVQGSGFQLHEAAPQGPQSPGNYVEHSFMLVLGQVLGTSLKFLGGLLFPKDQGPLVSM